jgi:peptidoglycan hydrolase CwlO-like protein
MVAAARRTARRAALAAQNAAVTTGVKHGRRALAGVAALVAAGAAASGAAGASIGSLQSRIAGVQRHEGVLRSRVHSDTARVRALAGSISDLQMRLNALQLSYEIEQRELDHLQDDLRASRARLVELQAQLVRGRAALRTQLVADYETPPPDLVTVLLHSNGFADLIERVDSLQRIEDGNVRTLVQVKEARLASQRETARLASLETRQQRITQAAYIQRQEVARLRYALAARRRAFARDRARANVKLDALGSHRRDLQHRLDDLQGPSMLGGLTQEGAYGFFQYPGTNYGVGNTPELARRLNRLGIALHLHLIGISGYRTPQHSVEVGGFANDPHTRGEASDTPGVEGVPEAVLNRFGLTRPFGGAREANHIQLA